MKMLCIRGRLHPAHTGLISGKVYEVYPAPRGCICFPSGYHAEGVVFYRSKTLQCIKCKNLDTFKVVPWSRNRFVPWIDLGVTEEEVIELNKPAERDKVT